MLMLAKGTRVRVFVGRFEDAVVLQRIVKGSIIDVYMVKLLNHKEVYVAAPVVLINTDDEQVIKRPRHPGRCFRIAWGSYRA